MFPRYRHDVSPDRDVPHLPHEARDGIRTRWCRSIEFPATFCRIDADIWVVLRFPCPQKQLKSWIVYVYDPFSVVFQAFLFVLKVFCYALECDFLLTALNHLNAPPLWHSLHLPRFGMQPSHHCSGHVLHVFNGTSDLWHPVHLSGIINEPPSAYYRLRPVVVCRFAGRAAGRILNPSDPCPAAPHAVLDHAHSDTAFSNCSRSVLSIAPFGMIKIG